MIQFHITQGAPYDRTIDAKASTLKMISSGSSTVMILGRLSPDAPAVSIFDDTVTTTISSLDISGIYQLQISVSGDPISGNMT